MSGMYFPPVEAWVLPMRAFQQSLQEMARDGREGNEGVALWLGRQSSTIAEITHVVGLRGSGVIKRPDQLHIASWLVNEVTRLAVALNLSLIGQIHSHGNEYAVDLSPTDRAYGIAVPYYLSVVAPDFGMNNSTQIAECGVHVFEPGLGYRRLPPIEIANRIRLEIHDHAEFVLVGED